MFSNNYTMHNQEAAVNEQPSSQINRNKQVPIGLLLPIIIPQLAEDKAIELQTLMEKLKVCFSNQFGYHVFFPFLLC